MKLTSETKLFLGILVATVGIIAGAVFLFSKPTPTLPREALLPEGTHTKGNPQAQVYLVEFSDFQCPACIAAKPYVDQIVEKYKDRLVFGYRHFPLPQHPYAQVAAYFAEAAGKQGKFWDVYDKLFEIFANNGTLSEEQVASAAGEFNLDIQALTKVWGDPKAMDEIHEKVASDVSYATSIGVNSTPTFFLNGKKLNLTTLDDLEVQVNNVIQ